MTVTELYAIDADVKGLVDQWVAHRRCPLSLVDKLLELDQPNAAACARWAATEPDRPVFLPRTGRGEIGTPCGPYPTMSGSLTWFFVTSHLEGDLPWANWTPKGTIPSNHRHGFVEAATAPDTILSLLDLWIVPEPEKRRTPPRKKGKAGGRTKPVAKKDHC